MSFVKKQYDNIEKSLKDSRLYRGLELQNGLKVMLISDTSTDKSAAALNVSVGHLCDPWELPGLAHFLEHMLFMGTKKYPLENEYSKFLSEHGGASNAFTATDHTNYFFDVAPAHLEPALDRFSQFFIEPLFTESATGREVNAVDSEHTKNIPSDSWRLMQLDRITSNSGHPYSKFGTGNKETLDTLPKDKNVNVREALLQFHDEYYSSNIMGLCILGQESLDSLQDLAVKYFKDVKTKDIPIPEWPEHPFSEEQKKIKAFVVPVRDVRSLNLTFPLPAQEKYYKSCPTHYIGHLVAHEGTGSLLSFLKKKGWVNSLLAGLKSGGRGFSFFVVNVDLTEEGLEHNDDIVGAVFQYLEMLRKDGPQEHIFEECKQLSSIQFQFKDKERPMSYTCKLAAELHTYPMEDVLSSEYVLTEWKPELITETLSYLTPDNVRLFIVAKAFEGKTDCVEKYYGTNYKVEKIPEDIVTKWKNAGINSCMHLPERNEFVPTKFDLKPRDELNTSLPRIIHDSPFCRLFFKQDDEYLLPKVCVFIQITSPLVYTDPLHVNLTTMLHLLFNDATNEELYPAEIAGLSFNIKTIKYGLLLTFKGYDDKVQVLCKKVMERLTRFEVDPVRFEIIKEAFVRGLKNFRADQPHNHVVYYTSLVMSERAWRKEELLDCIDDLTVERLRSFINVFFSRTHVESLVHGNVTENEALDLLTEVEKQLKNNCCSKPLLPGQLVKDREIQLDEGCYYILKATNDVHKSSAVEIYYQCSQEEIHMNTSLDLLCQIISEPCFNILRTQEQLGYIVFSGKRRGNGVQGLRIIIQSERHPEFLDGRVEAFLECVQGFLESMTDEEFSLHKAALSTKKLERPKTLNSLANFYWNEIASGDYNFGRHVDEVEYLKNVTKDDVVQFFKDLICKNSMKRKKLSVYVQSTVNGNLECDLKTSDSNDVKVQCQGTVIEDLAKFKSSKALYPLPVPHVTLKSHTVSKL
ncbi:insulin-degrading enzyme-like [Artemia franciscana]|uniref:insulin-degrading enzyme-like n=1 Tax=Artemia franciscana TaxID=6661 RepID=UPI0032DA06AF